MSSRLDAAGAEEDMQKGKAPKEYISAYVLLGHKMKNLMTLIMGWGAICLYYNCSYRLRILESSDQLIMSWFFTYL